MNTTTAAATSTTTSADQTIDFHVPTKASVDEFNGESIKENDAVLKFLSDMLMDDNLEIEQYTLHHDHCSSALLQATEKSLYDALIDPSSNFVEQPIQSLVTLMDSSAANTVVKQKNRYREADDFLTTHISRSSKQPAINDNDDDEEPLEMYDDVMLYTYVSSQRRRRSRKPKNNNKSLPKGEVKELVDLRNLLMNCAQAMERFDSKAAKDVLYQIRKHSSPLGTAPERLAHYFANALEARLSGTGTAAPTLPRASTTLGRGIFKSLRMCITSSPFMTMSNLFIKSTIANLAADDVAATVHVIDFGIMYGFQWPSLIQALSERPGGPPKLRITGIDDPLPGFRPAERVLHTGAHLARYCERFGVPFEYNGIAKAWDRIRIEDLKLGGEGEMVVVCSMYRMHGLSDNEAGSARDAVLKLIRQVEPRVFIHGVVNGSYKNAPFFVQRFKEALSHYGAFFDMLEATVTPDEEGQAARVGFEEIVLGGEAMNAIACEGADIVENRETYKQWGCRTRRIGLQQLPVEGEIMRCMTKVKSSYHKEFSVSEDEEWVLLQWKGRVIFAFSSWQTGNA